jgi:dodecin
MPRSWNTTQSSDRQAKEGTAMTTLKVIEVLSQSDKSWEDAAQVAVSDAAKSLRGIKSIYLKELEAVVENNKVTRYRINAKISFMVEGTQ